METETFKQNLLKLKESVLYLCLASEDDHNFGVPKLKNILYYADHTACRELKAPITGTNYLHFPDGPHPENWHVVRQEMAKDGDVEVVHLDDQYRAQQYLFIAQRKPDVGLFDPRELEILDQQVNKFQNFNAAGIGEYARQESAWISTENGEPMEYLIHGIVAGPMSVNSIKKGRTISDAAAQRRQHKNPAN